MKRQDLIILGVVLLAALAVWGGMNWHRTALRSSHRIAVIKQDQILIERIDLDAVSEPREIILPGKYREIVLVEKGRIRFKEANCPDKICVNTGWLDKPGDTAVCLPNRAVIVIED